MYDVCYLSGDGTRIRDDPARRVMVIEEAC
jgi:hypothetical protein